MFNIKLPDKTFFQQDVCQAIIEGNVCTRPYLEMDVCNAGSFRPSRVNDDDHCIVLLLCGTDTLE